MVVKLKFTAQLKEEAGIRADQIELAEGEKLQTVLKKLSDRYGKKFKNILFNNNGEYLNSNLIAINEFQVNYKENPSLKDGDELMIMSPIAGG